MYVRPLEYFILVSAMAGVVSLEVFLAPSNPRYAILTLLQIMIIGFSLGFSETLLFPGMVGVDPWWHQSFTNQIMSLGHIPEGYNYSTLPIFHLAIASVSDITGFDYKYSTMLSVQSIQIITHTCFVFLLGKIVVNERVGMLAGLFVAIANWEIHSGFWTIPTTLGFVLVPMIVYSLLKSGRVSHKQFMTTAIILMTTLILTHSLAALMLAIVLIVGATISTMNKGTSRRNGLAAFSPTTFMLYSAAMISWWALATKSFADFLGWMVEGFRINMFMRAPSQVVKYPANVPAVEQLLDNFGVFLFFALSFLGCFYMISKKLGRPAASMLAVTGLLTLALPYVSLLSRADILTDRWWQIGQILLALPLACSFLIVFGGQKWRTARCILICSSVFMLSLLMSLSTVANMDNNVLSPNTNVRVALTESELQAADVVWGMFNGTIATDLYYGYTLAYNENGGYYAISIDSQLFKASFRESSGNFVLIREEIAHNAFYLYTSLPWKLKYDPKSTLDSEGFARVYDCGSVTGFVKTE
jgi:hypothetical protein